LQVRLESQSCQRDALTPVPGAEHLPEARISFNGIIVKIWLGLIEAAWIETRIVGVLQLSMIVVRKVHAAARVVEMIGGAVSSAAG